jgi:predicted DNA-binding protein
MEINLKPELAGKLNLIASQSGRQVGQIVEELAEAYVDHDRWFRPTGRKGTFSTGSRRIH